MNENLALEEETKIIKFRPNARRLFFVSIIFIALAGIAPYLAVLELDEALWYLAWVAYAFVALFFVLIPYFSWLTKTTLVTTKRVVIRRGFFIRTTEEIHYQKVAEMKIRQGPIQRTFKSGDIVFRTLNGGGYILRDIPAVKANAEAIQQLLVV